MRLLFVDGIPGSGKSTLAEKLSSLILETGLDVKWYLEELSDHPVHPRMMRKSRHESVFFERCLQSWRRFTDEAQHKSTLHIMEGSIFQSTVRFMMEDEHWGISKYFKQFEEIVSPLSPALIYLRPRCAITHSRFTAQSRGDTWTDKVAGYLENTSYCRRSQLHGTEGMHSFWKTYAELCDSLVTTIGMPAKTIDVIPGEWDRHLSESMDFLTNQPTEFRIIFPTHSTP